MKSGKANQPREKITVGQLIEDLRVFDLDSELIFGDDELTFNRTKSRGSKLVQIEFNEEIEVKST